MTYRNFFSRIIVLSVFVIAGYLLARGIYYRSVLGIILAIVAIVAWAAFLYKVNKLVQEKGYEESLSELREDY